MTETENKLIFEFSNEPLDFQKCKNEKIEQNYYKTLERINYLRHNVDFNQDLGLPNIQKGSGFLVEMFFRFRKIHDNFSDIAFYIQQFNDELAFIDQAGQSVALQRKSVQFNKLVEIIEQIIYESFKLDQFKDKNIKLSDICVEGQQIVNQIKEFKKIIFVKEINCITQKCHNLIQKINGFLKQTSNEKIRFMIKQNIGYLCDNLNEEINFISQQIAMKHFNQIDETTNQNVIPKFQKLIQDIKNCFQSYNNNCKDLFVEEEEEEEVQEKFKPCETDLFKNETCFYQNFSKILKNFNQKNLPKIAKILRQFIIEKNIVENHDHLQKFKNIVLIIKQFLNHALNSSTNTIKSLSKFMYISSICLTNLFYKGFCQNDNDGPMDDAAGDDNNNDLNDGTGIGEGKGQENVSKEIEFEEQLIGLQGEEEQQDDDGQQDGEKDKDEDGFDMKDNDFEGKTGPEEQDEDDKKSDQKDDNLSEQLSEVDDPLEDYKNFDEDQQNDDEEEKDENEEQKNPREEKDKDFKAPQNDENQESRAKQENKEKQDQRNMKDFDQVDKQENEQDEGINEQDSNDQMDDLESDDQENQLDEIKNNPKEQIEEQNENDENPDFNFSEEGEISSETESDQQDDEEKIDDALDKPETKEEEEKQEKNQETDFQDLNNQMDIEDDQDENRQDDEQKMSNPQQQKANKNEQQAADLKGQNPIDEQEADDKNKNQMDQEMNDEGKEGQKNTNNDDNNGSPEEFMKKIIENMQGIMNPDDIKNMLKDLNVNQEKEQQNNTQNQNQNINHDDKMDMEYEVCEANLDENQLATNAATADQQQQALFQEDNDDMPQKENEVLEQEKQESNDNINEDMEQKNQKQNVQKNEQDQMQEEKEKIEKKLQDKDELTKNKYSDSKKPFQQKIEIIQQPEQEELINIEFEQMNLEEKQKNLTEMIKKWQQNPSDTQAGILLWQQIENEAKYYSMMLCEELKAVLEATKIASFKGDFKSGKRLNMKKIIPYIASNFRKDKIWLRRSEPSKRNYEILIAIDDSLSMKEKDVGYFALQSMVILGLGLVKVEVGEVAFASINDGLNLLHDFGVPFGPNNGPYILSQLLFDHQSKTSADLALTRFMRDSIDLFKKKREKHGSSSDHQICFILSDGYMNKKLVKPLCLEAEDNNLLFIFIILDQKDNEKNSIMNIKSANQVTDQLGKIKTVIQNYMDDFPFKHYIIIKDLNEISKTLVDILRQYFDMKKN